ncbi:MAG: hypothetical protein E3J65_03395 [Dehalococcoidia bacterium]|nr:MAG: hypothetical protein E3J65_03395 [Dehalococcoidia bacterium]
MLFTMWDAAKTAEVAQAADKVWASPPPGIKMLAHYICQGIPFPGVLLPPNTLVNVSVIEADSNEAIAATAYPLVLAGVTVWHVPVLELPVAGAAEVEKELRG